MRKNCCDEIRSLIRIHKEISEWIKESEDKDQAFKYLEYINLKKGLEEELQEFMQQNSKKILELQEKQEKKLNKIREEFNASIEYLIEQNKDVHEYFEQNDLPLTPNIIININHNGDPENQTVSVQEECAIQEDVDRKVDAIIKKQSGCE